MQTVSDGLGTIDSAGRVTINTRPASASRCSAPTAGWSRTTTSSATSSRGRRGVLGSVQRGRRRHRAEQPDHQQRDGPERHRHERGRLLDRRLGKRQLLPGQQQLDVRSESATATNAELYPTCPAPAAPNPGAGPAAAATATRSTELASYVTRRRRRRTRVLVDRALASRRSRTSSRVEVDSRSDVPVMRRTTEASALRSPGGDRRRRCGALAPASQAAQVREAEEDPDGQGRDDFFAPTDVKVKAEHEGQLQVGLGQPEPHNVTLTKGPKKVKKKDFKSATGLDRRQVQAEVREEGHLRLHLHDPPDGDEDEGHSQEVRPSRRLGPAESFFADAGGAFLCTLAGQEVLTRRARRTSRASPSGLEVPPKVAGGAARAGGARRRSTTLLAQAAARRTSTGSRPSRSKWDIVPTGRDADDGQEGQGARRSSPPMPTAPTRRTSPSRSGRPTIPGPLIEAEVGDTIIIHFQNKLRTPVTIHPHGVLYSVDMDGAYKGKFTDPGGFVQKGETFDYVWEAVEGTQGAWFYHDHGPMDPLPLYKGLFGPLHHPRPVRAPADEGVLHRLPLLPARRDRARPGLLLHQRPRLRRQHPDPAAQRRRRRRVLRLRDRRRLPHVPHPRAPLDDRRRGHR